jgi:3-methyl-2-oxobutanoate hydroxymethyltransferase
MTRGRVTTRRIREMKRKGEKIVTLTAYDHPTARLLDAAGVDILLVGDSLGMVVLGHESTLPVTLDDMVHHTKAVVRGRARALVVADMPFLTFQVSDEEAVRNAGRLVQEAGADAVKIEGGRERATRVRAIVSASIPVMGHLGLTPQSVLEFGGYVIQGRSIGAAERLVEDARALEEAGCFSMVLEGIPAPVAAAVTAAVSIPTIGIGAGPSVDGQVLVIHDLLGIHEELRPKFVRRYADLATVIREAVARFAGDVREGRFPSDDETYGS